MWHLFTQPSSSASYDLNIAIFLICSILSLVEHQILLKIISLVLILSTDMCRYCHTASPQIASSTHVSRHVCGFPILHTTLRLLRTTYFPHPHGANRANTEDYSVLAKYGLYCQYLVPPKALPKSKEGRESRDFLQSCDFLMRYKYHLMCFFVFCCYFWFRTSNDFISR